VKKKPVSITSAKYAHSDEIPGRMKRYLISMAIRTICFIGAVIAPNPYRWFLIAGAVLLPYFAVVIANAGQEQSYESSQTIEEQKQIEF
jgi:hypothetical protein